jgi:DNA-binding PadR family transcriptional regulator
MHQHCTPPFGFWMGGRHGGWGRWGGHRGAHRGRAGDFGFLASLFGEPGPRAERGDVKYLVLDAVADAPRHGYEIMQVIEERSKGAYRPSPGVVYPTLQLLDETGLLSSTEKEGRKVYALTDAGRAELEANRETVSDFYGRQDETAWEEYADELGELGRRLVGVVKAVHRAARRGRVNAKTLRQLRKIVDETVERVEDALDPDRRDA